MAEILSDEVFLELLRNTMKKEGFTSDFKIKVHSGSEAAGDGILGVNSVIEVSSGNKVLELFVKAAPKNEVFRRKFAVKEAFNREIYFYERVYPKFLEFQIERGIQHPFKSVAKCYGTSTENEHEFLILENLKEKGYVLFRKETRMNSEHIAFIFRQYARFHAISFVMKDQDKQLFKSLSENLDDLFSQTARSTGLDKAYAYYIEEAMKLFDPDKDNCIVKKMHDIKEILLDLLRDAGRCADEYSVVSQGDCWCNNMMFKYENSCDPTSPSDMKLLDWQFFRVNSPVLDLSYFFYGVASKEDMKGLDYYLDTYHGALSESIREMGGKPDELYSYFAFKDHWKKFSRFGLAQAFLIIRIMLTEKEDILNVAKSTESGKEFGESFIYGIKNEDLYNQRIRDVIKHFVYNGFV